MNYTSKVNKIYISNLGLYNLFAISTFIITKDLFGVATSSPLLNRSFRVVTYVLFDTRSLYESYSISTLQARMGFGLRLSNISVRRKTFILLVLSSSKSSGKLLDTLNIVFGRVYELYPNESVINVCFLDSKYWEINSWFFIGCNFWLHSKCKCREYN